MMTAVKRSCSCQTSQIISCKETVNSSNCNNTPLPPLHKLLPVDVIDLRLRVSVENKHQAAAKPANSARCAALYFASMSSFPVLPNLRRLDLSESSIADTRLLPADNSSLFSRFRSSPLKVVNLTGNSLQRLRLGAFADLQLVEQLDLSKNQISRLDPGCFFGLRQLKVLKMTANAISQLDSTVFDGLMHLSNLFLDENLLTTVDLDRLLWSLSCLDTLSLSGNRINRVIVGSKLPNDDRGRRRLSDVDAAANGNDDDDGTCLRQRLEFLDLSDNEIEDWPFQTENDNAAVDPVKHASSTRPDMLHLRNLVLDDNPIRLLTTMPLLPTNDDVTNRKRYAVIGSVERLSISQMSEMIGVDLSIFDGLLAEPDKLVELAMHDNQKLRYVDRSRDQEENGQSSLSRLYAHNNNLTTVPRQVLAGLQTISLYGNPLHCDCHLSWSQDIFGYTNRRRQSMKTSKSSTNFVKLLDANETRCAGPANISGWTIQEVVQLGWFVSLQSTSCPQRVVPLFDATTVLPLSSDLVLDCRVLVFSTSREDSALRRAYSSDELGGVTWTTPAIADRERRVRILRHPGRAQSGSALIVERVRARDAGAYRCIAAAWPTDARNNSMSVSTSGAQTVLRLYSVSASTFPVAVGPRSVTVIWNGTESTLTTSDYVIVYQPLPLRTSADVDSHEIQFCGSYGRNPPFEHRRPVLRCNGSTNADSGAILVRPFLRKYTVGGLQPNSAYQFCMAVRSGDSGSHPSLLSSVANAFAKYELTKLNCINVTTRPEILDASRWFATGSGFTLAIIVFGVMTSLLCVVCTSALRFRKRKWYSEPEVVIVPEETVSATMKLTAALRRGPSKVVKYGLPLDDLTGAVAIGIMSATSTATLTPSTQRTSLATDCSNTMLNYRHSLSNSTTSLVGSIIQ